MKLTTPQDLLSDVPSMAGEDGFLHVIMPLHIGSWTYA